VRRGLPHFAAGGHQPCQARSHRAKGEGPSVELAAPSPHLQTVLIELAHLSRAETPLGWRHSDECTGPCSSSADTDRPDTSEGTTVTLAQPFTFGGAAPPEQSTAKWQPLPSNSTAARAWRDTHAIQTAGANIAADIAWGKGIGIATTPAITTLSSCSTRLQLVFAFVALDPKPPGESLGYRGVTREVGRLAGGSAARKRQAPATGPLDSRHPTRVGGRGQRIGRPSVGEVHTSRKHRPRSAHHAPA
jgi:hypothetical protein